MGNFLTENQVLDYKLQCKVSSNGHVFWFNNNNNKRVNVYFGRKIMSGSGVGKHFL